MLFVPIYTNEFKEKVKAFGSCVIALAAALDFEAWMFVRSLTEFKEILQQMIETLMFGHILLQHQYFFKEEKKSGDFQSLSGF